MALNHPAGPLPGPPKPRYLLSASAGLVLLVVGVLAIGIGLGWIAHARFAPAGAPAVVNADIVVPSLPPAEAAQTAGNTVPDVRGLTQQDAQQALADAGLPIDAVKVVQQPYVGAADLIIAQQPIGGAAYVDGVTIVLPVPATMPDLKGKSEAEARQALTDLGSFATTAHQYVDGVAPGVVVATDPAAGAALGEDATIVIADPPSSRYLVEVNSSGDCSAGTSVAVNGTTYGHGVSCNAGRDARDQVWLLDRKVTRVAGVAGITDRSDPGVDATVTVIGDGAELFSGTVKYGSTIPIDVVTAGVLRLSVEVKLVDPQAQTSPQVGFGDLAITGAEADLVALVAR